MRSVNQALVWELARHWHWLFGAFLLANALPCALLAALVPMGLAAQSREFVMLYVTLVPLSILLVGLGYLIAMGSRQRLFSLPISNTCMANWALWGGALWMGTAVASGISILNMAFNIHWPWLTTACFAMTAWCVIQPLLGAPIGLVGRVLAILLSIVGLVFAFVSRNSFSSSATVGKYWTELTIVEAITMFATCLAAFAAFLRVVEWERCGESESKGDDALRRVMGWCDSIGEKLRVPIQANASPSKALLWHEWRVKGYLYPLLAGLFAAAFAMITLLESSTLTVIESEAELQPRYMSISLFWISVAAIPAGIVLGMTGTNATEDTSKKGSRSRLSEAFRDSNGIEMGSWMRTLPITSNRLATAMMQNTAMSLAFGLLVWFAISLGAHWWCSDKFLPSLLSDSKLLPFCFASVMVPWSIALNMVAVTASGRPAPLIFVCFAIPVAVVLSSLPFPNASTITWAILWAAYLMLHLPLMKEAWIACSRRKWIAAGVGFLLLSFLAPWCMSHLIAPTSFLLWFYVMSLLPAAVVPVVALPAILDRNRYR